MYKRITADIEGNVVHIKLVYAPSNSLLTIPRRQFCHGSLLPVFLCQMFCDVSPYVCSYYFSSVSVDEWPPLGK